jgi:acyl-lipid omega-6 desaturase (Delta-12 desaturase)
MPDNLASAVSGAEHRSTRDHFRQTVRSGLAAYAKPDRWRAALQLVNTILPLLASMAALFYGLDRGYWLAALLALPAALLVVRLFVIQHDCGHGSFFASRRANESVGLVISMLTLMPFSFWRRTHSVHHATSGNLDRRGTGDIATLTVVEYRSRSPWGRLVYRLYRHPLILFGVGPAYLLLVRYRVPLSLPLRDWQSWFSILATDAIAIAIVVGLAMLVGVVMSVIALGGVFLLATSIGMWLFYVQHQFEDAYWRRSPDWDFHAAALHGSSFYDLPKPLHWFTASIGFHHIHHLVSKIPNYRLQACYRHIPELRQGKPLTLWASLKSVRLALWDEERQRLVSFRQVATA